MGKIYGKVDTPKRRRRKKKVDEHRRKRDIFLNFRMTQKEKDLIEARIAMTGLTKATFFIESCLYQKILVKGNIRTFSVMKDTLRDLTEKIDRNPDLTQLDPTDAERLKTILEITNYLFGERR
ncbi:MAG: hypothetical protein J5778_03260 [Clostridiales bacterium]|jgi:hypothetical protein|nr:hypothetical protein [Clostridiales bacterium]